MERRERAAQAYATGDPTQVEVLSAFEGQAIFFDPGCGFTEGAAQVNAVNRKGAQSFGPKGKSQFDIKDIGVSDELAFSTGFQNAEVEVVESGEIKKMKIRVTEIFRLINGEWRMSAHEYGKGLSSLLDQTARLGRGSVRIVEVSTRRRFLSAPVPALHPNP